MKAALAILLLLVLSTVIAGCSPASEFESVTYTISRSGVLLGDERFDVVHVYGFVDNGEIARQITEFLNQSEPNTYHYQPTD
jgi:hypothetical protein